MNDDGYATVEKKVKIRVKVKMCLKWKIVKGTFIHFRQKKSDFFFFVILYWTKNCMILIMISFSYVVSDFLIAIFIIPPKLSGKKKKKSLVQLDMGRGGRLGEGQGRILLLHSVFCVQKSTLSFYFFFFF